MPNAENDALACGCGHGVAWHHDTRGCGYLGFAPDHRCPCRLLPDEAVRRLMVRAWDEGFLNAAGQDHPAYPRTRRIDNPYERPIPPGSDGGAS